MWFGDALSVRTEFETDSQMTGGQMSITVKNDVLKNENVYILISIWVLLGQNLTSQKWECVHTHFHLSTFGSKLNLCLSQIWDA